MNKEYEIQQIDKLVRIMEKGIKQIDFIQQLEKVGGAAGNNLKDAFKKALNFDNLNDQVKTSFGNIKDKLQELVQATKDKLEELEKSKNALADEIEKKGKEVVEDIPSVSGDSGASGASVGTSVGGANLIELKYQL